MEKLVKNKTTRQEEMKWIYTYPIEQKLRTYFSEHGSNLFGFIIFDCCRSFFNEKEALLSSEWDEIQPKNEGADPEESKELPRGDGGLSKGLNMMMMSAS
eukprot:CAMPEP_0116877996 /NCGR_PEP_ID=MMETSP0463-20121206/9750_1 /TAXON_ID=181622 /ORGANISM="Strombidinopsis sp, Strain SopsisLIS2011" /LENGTH=99 /DNA_ID=CAMNT_0004525783 /DNA_START=294 /DNA_END=593 /DNA_ORIENTATION=-